MRSSLLSPFGSDGLRRASDGIQLRCHQLSMRSPDNDGRQQEVGGDDKNTNRVGPASKGPEQPWCGESEDEVHREYEQDKKRQDGHEGH